MTKKNLKEIIEEDRKNQEIRKQQMNEIISCDSYILWLQYFTLMYSSFTDDEFLYNKKSISKENLEQVKKLSLLYKGIRQYADKNYLYPFIFDYEEYFKIKYNDIGYEIGFMSDNKSFYCSRIELSEDGFIDFNDIILDKKQPNTDYIDKNLLQLSCIITYYYEQGIPIKALKMTLENTLWDLEQLNNENKCKVYKKCLKN